MRSRSGCDGAEPRITFGSRGIRYASPYSLSVITFCSRNSMQFLLQPAVDRQPGHRRGDREEVGGEIYIISSLDYPRII